HPGYQAGARLLVSRMGFELLDYGKPIPQLSLVVFRQALIMFPVVSYNFRQHIYKIARVSDFQGHLEVLNLDIRIVAPDLINGFPAIHGHAAADNQGIFQGLIEVVAPHNMHLLLFGELVSFLIRSDSETTNAPYLWVLTQIGRL